MKYKGMIYKIPHNPTTSVHNKVREMLQIFVTFCLFLSSFDKDFLHDHFFLFFDDKEQSIYFILSFSEIAFPALSGIQTMLLTIRARKRVTNISIKNHTKNLSKISALLLHDAISSTVYSPAIAPDKASNALSNRA